MICDICGYNITEYKIIDCLCCNEAIVPKSVIRDFEAIIGANVSISERDTKHRFKPGKDYKL